MASLGQDLKRERELRGISLREIADTTRISLKFLQAIEDDRLEIIPGGFFIRAILRSYARSIGIDEQQVLNTYEERQSFSEQLTYGLKKDRALKTGAPRRRIISSRALLWAGAFGLLAAAIFLGVLIFSHRASPPALLTVNEPPPLPAAETPSESPPPPEAPTVAEEPRGIALKMDFGEQTWLHIFADGDSAWNGMKNPGETLEIRAENEILIHCGNAGGAVLTLNGRPARPLGPSGAVRKDVRITAENWREFLLPEARE